MEVLPYLYLSEHSIRNFFLSVLEFLKSVGSDDTGNVNENGGLLAFI